MFAAFSAEIEFKELYCRHYQPAKHPGDAQRAARLSRATLQAAFMAAVLPSVGAV